MDDIYLIQMLLNAISQSRDEVYNFVNGLLDAKNVPRPDVVFASSKHFRFNFAAL